jgi:hypothetical protein
LTHFLVDFIGRGFCLCNRGKSVQNPHFWHVLWGED